MKYSQQIHLKIRNVVARFLPSTFENYKSKKEMESYRIAILKNGFRLPLPPVMKTAILRWWLRECGCKYLVETGTFLGDTCWAFRNECEKLFTIEINPQLAQLARSRFRGFSNVRVLEGDSAELLKTILPQLQAKTLFWLDGHFSGGITGKGTCECPLYDELQSIMTMCPQSWVILIDDARCFDSDPAYPKMKEMAEFIKSFCPDCTIETANDIVVVR